MGIHRACSLPVFALLAAACAADAGEPSLNHYADEMAASLDAVEAAAATHQQQILVQPDLQRMLGVEQEYMDGIATRVGRINDAQDSMQLCGMHMDASGATESVQLLQRAQTALAGAIEIASNETDRHLQVMRGAVDVHAALLEEHRHQTDMEPLLDQIRMRNEELGGALQAMQDEGFSMMCPISSHVHQHD